MLVLNVCLRDTNSLVEEFMLLANISVAKKLYEHFPQHAVLRKHPVPSESMFETLIKSAASQVFCSFIYLFIDQFIYLLDNKINNSNALIFQFSVVISCISII